MRLIGFLSLALGIVCLAQMPAARADGPDYDGTLAYIKSRLNGTLMEQRQCVFRAVTSASDKAHVFHAGALDIVPSVITSSKVDFACRKGDSCVTFENNAKTASVSFTVHSDTEGVAIAISRLVEMCGLVAR